VLLPNYHYTFVYQYSMLAKSLFTTYPMILPCIAFARTSFASMSFASMSFASMSFTRVMKRYSTYDKTHAVKREPLTLVVKWQPFPRNQNKGSIVKHSRMFSTTVPKESRSLYRIFDATQNIDATDLKKNIINYACYIIRIIMMAIL
jgi:hypothetical protein